MTTTELLTFHKAFCDQARGIVETKNHDYAGASGDTPFANFTATEKLGITTTEKGFLIRMLDKMQRLSTFANAGELKVANESAHDACMDIVNYAVMLSAYIREKAGDTPIGYSHWQPHNQSEPPTL
jgi:hypothetical protein